MAEIEQQPGAELDSLASEIRREHEAVISGVRATVEAAIRCGNLLREAKGKVGHGGWGVWLAEKFPASDRTARSYMRLSERYANRQLPANLTIDGALKQLAAPRGDRGEVAVEGDDGPYPVLSDDEIEAKARARAEALEPLPDTSPELFEREKRIAYHLESSDLFAKKAGYGYLNLAARFAESAPSYAALADRYGHLLLASPEPFELVEEKAGAKEALDKALDALCEFNDEELRRWVEEGKTQTWIAKQVGRSQQAVSERCKRLGITPSKHGERRA